MTFSSQSKALLLLITDRRVQLLQWHNRILTSIGTYGAAPEDQENFATELPNHSSLPVIILTDLIEENFRHDTIVHVSGSDREALIRRKLDFAFRNTSYRLGKITGRQRDGRRDDLLMMSAITRPDRLDTWLNILLQQKFAIQSITSVAHLLGTFASINQLQREPYLLIINLDEDNNLRQTFLKNGQILFSRLTTLPAREGHEQGNDIYQETLQIRQYFERIQFVPYEIPLRIQVYAPFAETLLQLEARSNESNRFEVVDVRHSLSEMQLDSRTHSSDPVYFFLQQVLGKQRPENIYAAPAIRKYHGLNALARNLALTAGGLMVLALLINFPAGLKIKNSWQELDSLTVQTLPLQAEYSLLSQRFPATPIPSNEMELVVMTHDLIQSQIHFPPDVLNMISHALARSPGLLLTGITWQLSGDTAKVPGSVSRDGNPDNQPPQASSDSGKILDHVLQYATKLAIQIDGQAYSPDSFRDAQEQVLAFVDALSANPDVHVFASRMPTDVRTDIRVSTTVNDGEVRAPFTLELALGETAQ